MSSGFRDLVAHVEENVFLDPDYFAETVRIVTDDNRSYQVVAHVVNTTKEEDGMVVETLQCRLLIAGLPAAPANGWRLYRGDDTRAFVFRYQHGRTTENSYLATFERRTQKRATAAKHQ